MSHIVKVKALQVKDEQALREAVKRSNASLVEGGVVKRHILYGGQQADGIGVKLNGWTYPAVFNLESGEVKYDNFNGRWGATETLDGFLHDYTLAATVNAARLQDPGVYTREEQLENGDTKLVLEYA